MKMKFLLVVISFSSATRFILQTGLLEQSRLCAGESQEMLTRPARENSNGEDVKRGVEEDVDEEQGEEED